MSDLPPQGCPKCKDPKAWTKCWECGWTEPDAEGPWVFEMPLPINIANTRLEWRAKLSAKNKWYAACDERVSAGLLPGQFREPLQRASVHAHFCVHNPMDRDNLGARAKWLLDFLVTRGYLADDSDKIIDWIPPTQETDRKNKRVVVTLTRL